MWEGEKSEKSENSAALASANGRGRSKVTQRPALPAGMVPRARAGGGWSSSGCVRRERRGKLMKSTLARRIRRRNARSERLRRAAGWGWWAGHGRMCARPSACSPTIAICADALVEALESPWTRAAEASGASRRRPVLHGRCDSHRNWVRPRRMPSRASAPPAASVDDDDCAWMRRGSGRASSSLQRQGRTPYRIFTMIEQLSRLLL